MSGLLVDSSIWVEVFRQPPDSSVSVRLAAAARDRGPLYMAEPIAMELLAGARGPELATVQTLVDSLIPLATEPGLDFRAGASLYRDARADGRSIRSLVDCLIAATAIRHGVTVIHRDNDFDSLAHVSALSAENWND